MIMGRTIVHPGMRMARSQTVTVCNSRRKKRKCVITAEIKDIWLRIAQTERRFHAMNGVCVKQSVLFKKANQKNLRKLKNRSLPTITMKRRESSGHRQ